jgi:outer membrane beta-barrel protein
MLRTTAIQILLLCWLFSSAWGQNSGATPLDARLKLNNQDEVSAVFEGVVAVQRKAKIKAGSFLFSPMFSFDFSDAPYTQYSLQLNGGYAFSEALEVYLAYSPVFISTERNLSKQVKKLGFVIDAEKPQSFIGIEVNWIPIYGKDSWGPYNIVRSDTFLNFSFGQITYEENQGNKIKLALGKTFFFTEQLNFRVQAGPSLIETFSSTNAEPSKRESITVGLIETGFVFYF